MFETTIRTATTPTTANKSTGSRPQRATMGLSRFLKHGLEIMAFSHKRFDGVPQIPSAWKPREESAFLGAGQDQRRRRDSGQVLRRASLDLEPVSVGPRELGQDVPFELYAVAA